jgi:hypothetical protein
MVFIMFAVIYQCMLHFAALLKNNRLLIIVFAVVYDGVGFSIAPHILSLQHTS